MPVAVIVPADSLTLPPVTSISIGTSSVSSDRFPATSILLLSETLPSWLR